MESLENNWLECLVKLYEKELMLDKGIFKGNKKEQLLGNLEVLEKARQKIILTQDKKLEKLYKEFYYDLYVIKESNIPYSVYEKEIAQEREKGHENVSITEEYKKRKNQDIIEDQKESLDQWIEYFLYDEEAKNYKSWEVFWILEGLQKLGEYDKKYYTYSRRDKTTIYPYPEVDKQAISNALNLMREYLKNKKGPEELKSALGQANFQHLFEYSQEQLFIKEIYNITEGKWIKYDMGSDYHKLKDSLKGYKTGWCTETGKNFAKKQLESGDFYIYFSLDENGEYKIPRIAIKMDGKSRIEEIRGVEQNQNIEAVMLPILEEKIKEFINQDDYLKQVHDMKQLTIIDNKNEKGIELNLDELKFLYEIDSKIEGFGLISDPRIKEIQSKRNKKQDYSKIYNCKEDELTLSVEDGNKIQNNK